MKIRYIENGQVIVVIIEKKNNIEIKPWQECAHDAIKECYANAWECARNVI